MPIKKKLQILSIALTTVLVIISIILLIIYNVLQISYNSTENNEVDSQVTITRDNKGIPAVEAESINDFYFALGYLHAKDRLNVIEYLRSIATGESEKFTGNDSILVNNLSRTAGFTKNAEEIILKLKENEILALKNYVRGINHLRNKNRVRNLISREWRIEDVLAILSMKDWANSYLNNKELLFNLPDTKIQASKNFFINNKYLHFYKDDDQQYIYTLKRVKEIIEKYICTFARGNSIHISKEYSTSGAESFTTLNYEDSSNIYPGWYPVKLTLKGKKNFVVTYNGLPFIMSFKNEAISLTQININADTQNFYLFETDYKNGIPHYKSAGIWKEYKSVRIPSFNDSEVNSEIKWITDKGPIFSELISTTKTDSRIMVIDSVQPGIEYINMMLKVPFETEIEKIKQMILLNDSSLKSFNISDNKKAYNIISGLINQSDNNNQIFVEGSKSLKSPNSKISIIRQITDIDYTGSDLVSIKDISYNYKNCITNEFKIERFNQLIIKKKIYDTNQIKNIITDNYSIAAEKFAPLFASMLVSNPLTSSKLTRIYFSDWDYSSKSGLQAPSIFYTTLDFFITETYKDDFSKDSEFNLNYSYLLYPEFFELCQKNVISIFDKPYTSITENRETIYDIAFLNSMRFLNRKNGPLMENWKWGSIIKSKYKIPRERLFFFSRFYKIKDLALSGGPDTIENTMYNDKFITSSSTSFQSFISNDTLQFKMNSGYSTSMLSDFYYGNNTIENFVNMDTSGQIYKTTINNY